MQIKDSCLGSFCTCRASHCDKAPRFSLESLTNVGSVYWVTMLYVPASKGVLLTKHPGNFRFFTVDRDSGQQQVDRCKNIFDVLSNPLSCGQLHSVTVSEWMLRR